MRKLPFFTVFALMLIASAILTQFSGCSLPPPPACAASQWYVWNDQIGSNPPQAMLDELTNILNNSTCNPNLETPCEPTATYFKEIVLGETPAEAVQDDYGDTTGDGIDDGGDGIEDFAIWHNVVSSSSIPVTLTIAQLNEIRDEAIYLAKQSAPYCSCQSRRAKIVHYEVKAWGQTYPFNTNNQWRRSLHITVTYHCCGLCA